MNPNPAVAKAAGAPVPSRSARWAGLGLGAIALLFLLFDMGMKLVLSPEALAGTEELGFPVGVVRPLGLLQLLLLALYLYPRTSAFGAVLWTGYLGGAVATNVRLENPVFSHILFPVYVAVFLWGALWLRNPRLRAIFPFNRAPRR